MPVLGPSGEIPTYVLLLTAEDIDAEEQAVFMYL